MPGSLKAQTAAGGALKAAFLYKFASFVEWPEGSVGRELRIGVMGHDPFEGDLDRIVQGRAVGGRFFRIRHFKSGQAIEACEILFIGPSEVDRIPSILEELNGAPTLTVSDVPGFCESGGMIALRLSGDRILLRINLQAVERSNLQISSKLLSLTSVVRLDASAGAR